MSGEAAFTLEGETLEKNAFEKFSDTDLEEMDGDRSVQRSMRARNALPF
jgi:hypothetical protein